MNIYYWFFIILLLIFLTCFLLYNLHIILPIYFYFSNDISPMPTNNKIVFITYGDDKYKQSKLNIIEQAKKTGIFTHFYAYNRDIIHNIIKNKGNKNTMKVFNMPRGGGYWIWKPIIIQYALNYLSDGDILVYGDAGSTIINTPYGINSLKKDINFINNDNKGLSHCGTSGGGRIYLNRMDVMLNLVNDVKKYLNTNGGIEYEAGRLLMRKNNFTINFINEFADVAFNNPDYFTDNKSSVKNLHEFIEHRHDQSIYNCLAYKHGISGNGCNIGAWLAATRIKH